MSSSLPREPAPNAAPAAAPAAPAANQETRAPRDPWEEDPDAWRTLTLADGFARLREAPHPDATDTFLARFQRFAHWRTLAKASECAEAALRAPVCTQCTHPVAAGLGVQQLTFGCCGRTFGCRLCHDEWVRSAHALSLAPPPPSSPPPTPAPAAETADPPAPAPAPEAAPETADPPAPAAETANPPAPAPEAADPPAPAPNVADPPAPAPEAADSPAPEAADSPAPKTAQAAASPSEACRRPWVERAQCGGCQAVHALAKADAESEAEGAAKTEARAEAVPPPPLPLQCPTCKHPWALQSCAPCGLFSNRPLHHCAQCTFCRWSLAEGAAAQPWAHCAACNVCVHAQPAPRRPFWAFGGRASAAPPTTPQPTPHGCGGRALTRVDCVVCHEPLVAIGRTFGSLQCDHLLHIACAESTIARPGADPFDMRCPTCRRSVFGNQAANTIWAAYRAERARLPLPPDMQRSLTVVCLDCSKQSNDRPWHFLGTDCGHCGSFNTAPA